MHTIGINKYYNSTALQSYNAVYNFVISNRNYGKTWGAQKRAFVRGMKHRRRTIWVRRFDKEAKQAAAKLYKSADLCKWINAVWYDKETKQGNIRQQGRYFYCKTGGKWFCFLEVIALEDGQAMRSADDVCIDTIVFDEFTTTVDRYRRFRGNEVEKFIDLFYSLKRQHQVNCFLFGNKESVSNPYFSYFGIRPLPADYEGIRTYRDGSIAIQQINNKQIKQTIYDEKVEKLLAGTSYGNYLGNQYKNAQNVITSRVPSYSTLYIQIDYNGAKFAIRQLKGRYYITNKLSFGDIVYCDHIKHEYKQERVLLASHRKFLKPLVTAYSLGKVSYTSPAEYEAFITFLEWLNI